MRNINACIACLATDRLLHSLDDGNLGNFYHHLTNIALWENDESSKRLCYECLHNLKRCKRFRDKCIRAKSALDQISTGDKVMLLSILPNIRTDYELQSQLCIFNFGSITSIAPSDAIFHIKEEPGIVSENHKEVKIEVEFSNEGSVTSIDRSEDDLSLSEVISRRNILEEGNLKVEFDAVLADVALKCKSQLRSQEDGCKNETRETEQAKESLFTVKEEKKKNFNKSRRRKSNSDSSSDDSSIKRPYQKKRKQVKIPLTGPFECLQPSASVADGTCHQTFSSCCDYSMHYRDVHTTRIKTIKCQVCEKLIAASKVEEPSTPKSCQVCGLGSQSDKELSKHTNTVHLKPFTCELCPKSFTLKGGLQQHMRVHTGEKPFSCPYCTKAFTQKSGLDQHKRTHTKIKPYRCVICGKNFVQSVHLRQHMRTHTNITPFQCVLCEKRFKQSSQLNNHLRNHSENNITEEQKKKYHGLVGTIKDNEEEAQIIQDADS